MQSINEYFPKTNLQIPIEAVLFFSNLENPFLTIQVKDRGYIFCNNTWLKLFNIKKLASVIYKKDEDFTDNNALAKRYHAYYDQTLALEKSISVTEPIEPKNRGGIRKMMTGMMYPLYVDSDKPNALLSIAVPENRSFSLSTEGILHLSNIELEELLTRKRYEISLNNKTFAFTKRELLCLIELFKGKHAGEIALTLNIKQVTVESYISNLKNKCGVNLKSSLIAFFIDNGIFQKIFV